MAHALVGGVAISIRAEVRFARAVDLAISVDSDSDLERITRALAFEGFALVAVVEQDDKVNNAEASQAASPCDRWAINSGGPSDSPARSRRAASSPLRH